MDPGDPESNVRSKIGSMLFFVPGLIVLAYGIYDAYTTAKKMNEGEIPSVPYKPLHIIGFIIIVFVVIIFTFLSFSVWQ